MEKTMTQETFVRQTYLQFFNRYLLERGMIDEKEYVQLKNQIFLKYGSKAKNR